MPLIPSFWGQKMSKYNVLGPLISRDSWTVFTCYMFVMPLLEVLEWCMMTFICHLMSHSLTSVRSQVQPSLTNGEHRRIDLLNETRKYVCMCQMISLESLLWNDPHCVTGTIKPINRLFDMLHWQAINSAELGPEWQMCHPCSLHILRLMWNLCLGGRCLWLLVASYRCLGKFV